MINRNTTHILRTAGIYILVLIFSLPSTGRSQFIDLSLDIEPEVTAQTRAMLDFGTVVTNAGRKTVNLGDVGMGIFSITALERQEILIDLQKPSSLIHGNPAITDTIPLQLFVRYGYSTGNYRDSEPIPESVTSILVRENSDPGPWNTLYLFIYGSIEVGNIAEGTYTNDIVLNIEYL